MITNSKKEYKLEIDPKILELLGPSLYTNIYYVLAELIANSYDAKASNVYITQDKDSITVEDDGNGMSYEEGDIGKYLQVAVETRTTEEESFVEGTKKKRRRMGRKGVGKLAALSVSENVHIMTVKNEDKSGFILSRHVGKDCMLKPLDESQIEFKHIKKHGTSVVMTSPQYGLHKTSIAIKNNLIKIFPLVNSEFKIHIKTEKDEMTIDNFDKEMIDGLGALIMIGKEYHHLSKSFRNDLKKKELSKNLVIKRDSVLFPLTLLTKERVEKNFSLEIKGWIGAYRTTRDRKSDPHDFPDNFISLLSNGKLGEYNILPTVGRNRLQEVYIVGQLHIDLFEETELPDISLSNRQGYKTDDLRYQTVLSYVRDTLLPEILDLRLTYASYKKDEKDAKKDAAQKKKEIELRKSVEKFKTKTSQSIAKSLSKNIDLKDHVPTNVVEMVQEHINNLLPMLGLKNRIDEQKKIILISHTKVDKPLADIIYKMLVFNNIPDNKILYTNCDDAVARIPNGMDVFDYLRNFFVESYSSVKPYVAYVTSDDMAKSWGAVSEVGAGWITKRDHEIFTIKGHWPQRPLDNGKDWQTSIKNGSNIEMSTVEFSKFVVKIMDICRALEYKPQSEDSNKKELRRLVTIV